MPGLKVSMLASLDWCCNFQLIVVVDTPEMSENNLAMLANSSD